MMLSIILSLASCNDIMVIAFLMKRSTVKLFKKHYIILHINELYFHVSYFFSTFVHAN